MIDGRWEKSPGASAWKDEREAHRVVCDYIAGMTDRFALSVYDQVFLPKRWSVI
jgi:dGTPase